jgi:succinyl-diaminopimelate desuccinylase
MPDNGHHVALAAVSLEKDDDISREDSMDPREQLEQQLRQDRDDIISLVQEMVRIPSENPPGDTTALYAFVTDYLERRGLDFETVAPVPEWPNLLASFDGGEPGRHLVLNGHLDIFPAGDHTKWSADPYSGHVQDDKLYGRGVSDMKAGTAASILTYVYLARIRDQLKGRLTLTAVSDEETGGVWGTQYLLANHPITLGDCVLNGEPSTPRTIRFGEKGPLWIEVEVATPGGHGAYTHVSRNAIIDGAELITELRSLTQLPFEIPDTIADKIEAVREALDEVLGSGATDVVRAITLNIGLIRGGVKMNMIAPDCHIEVDLRCPVGVTNRMLLDEFEKILARYEGVSYTVAGGHDPTVCDPDHELVAILQRNAEAVRGIRPLPAISIGGTDCRLWRERGIPAYVYGPTPYNMGAPDEHVTLDDLLGTVHVHVLSAFDYLMASPPVES